MPPRCPRPALAALVLAAFVRPAVAQQVVTTLDVGGTGLEWGDSVTTTRSVAGSIAPAIRAEWSSATLGASGSWAYLGDSWSAQGALAGSVYTPSLGPLIGELSAVGAGSLHSDRTQAGQSQGVGRLHLMGGAGGLWAGGGGGGTWDQTDGWRPITLGDAGAWTRWRAATALVTATPTWVDAEPVFTDGELAIRVSGTRAEFGAVVGARFGTVPEGLTDDTRQWVSASLLVRMPLGLALVAGAGSYPADLVQRFPGGRFASLGVRFGRWPVTAGGRGADVSRRDVDPARRDAPDAEDDVTVEPTAEESAARAGGMLGFEARRDATTGGAVLRVRAPGAHFVEVYGGFTNWQPVALARGRDGWWTVTLPLAAGTHEVSVRVDGGAWLVPPGTTAVRDEFGGTAGVMVVP